MSKHIFNWIRYQDSLHDPLPCGADGCKVCLITAFAQLLQTSAQNAILGAFSCSVSGHTLVYRLLKSRCMPQNAKTDEWR